MAYRKPMVSYRKPMVLYGFIWFYMVCIWFVYGFIWFYMVLYGFIWNYMVLYGCNVLRCAAVARLCDPVHDAVRRGCGAALCTVARCGARDRAKRK